MDPDANWQEATVLAGHMIANSEKPPHVPPDHNDALRLAELVVALDGWLKNGGFPPKAWKKSES
jgi:hypothetical protein